ncbi:MAG TPA: hypothetical protein VGW74_13110 [Propionibacteriaceae bacterium]|nr:hypothetical protein [Propionibacteriaceae bacterium]
MTIQQFDGEHGWLPAKAHGYTGNGPDIEVYRNDHEGGWSWWAYSRDGLLGSGTARTRPGLWFGVWRAYRRLEKDTTTRPNQNGAGS